MAIKRIVRSVAMGPVAARMVSEIRGEMSRPESKAPLKSAPTVIAEEDEGSGYVNYYVVWDKFKAVDHETRTRIVLNAVQLEKPKDYKRILIALGLTRKQAEQMGLEFMAMVTSN